MDMEPRVVKANPLVKDDEGRIAFEKGPVVYCAEWPDNEGISVREVAVSADAALSVRRAADKLYGIDEIIIDNGDADVTLIPYYAWNHRGAGDMAVWLHQAAE